MTEKKYLTPPEVVERFRGAVTESTLAQWRHKKTGPGYTKIGSKILYPLNEIEKWEEEKNVKNKSADNT